MTEVNFSRSALEICKYSQYLEFSESIFFLLFKPVLILVINAIYLDAPDLLEPSWHGIHCNSSLAMLNESFILYDMDIECHAIE